MSDCMQIRAMKMLASTEVKSVELILTMMVCTSLAVVSDGRVVARRRIQDVDDGYSSASVAQYGCQPSTEGVVPALCGVCDHLPDYLVADCCRWCFTEKTSHHQSDTDDELGAAIDADKRAKYFLGKRAKYFLGK